jgi:hypothetical protein
VCLVTVPTPGEGPPGSHMHYAVARIKEHLVYHDHTVQCDMVKTAQARPQGTIGNGTPWSCRALRKQDYTAGL